MSFSLAHDPSPFLILGNKIDIQRAASEDELRQELGLTRTTGKGKVPLQVSRSNVHIFKSEIGFCFFF